MLKTIPEQDEYNWILIFNFVDLVLVRLSTAGIPYNQARGQIQALLVCTGLMDTRADAMEYVRLST